MVLKLEVTENNYSELVPKLEAEVDAKLELLKADGYQKQEVLRDPTLWANTILRDEQGKKWRNWGFQDVVLNDKSRFVLVAASNQVGKTQTAVIKALHHALHVKNASVIIGSRTEEQSIRVLDQIKGMMRRSKISFEEIVDKVDNRTELHFSLDKINVSIIKCVPATEAALGYPASLLILDEFGFWENADYLYEQVFEPRTNAMKDIFDPEFTMGQVFIISNPNGMGNKFHQLFKRDPRYSTYRFCWLARPLNKYEDYLAHKERLGSTQWWFDSVYAAEFSEASGGFITYKEWLDATKPYEEGINPGLDLHLGLDKTGEDTKPSDKLDWSWLIGVHVRENEGKKTVEMAYWKSWYGKDYVYYKEEGKTGNQIYDELERLQKTCPVSGITYDKVGVGDSVLHDLLDRQIFTESQINPQTFSLPNKTDIYNNMKSLFEKRLIRIPADSTLKEQLLGLRFERTEAGHLKIHHASENLKDDAPDALACSCWQALRVSGGQASFSFIPTPEPKTKGRQESSLFPKKGMMLAACQNCYEYAYVQKMPYTCESCLKLHNF